MTDARPQPAPRRTRWISNGLERLIHDLETSRPAATGASADFDVVVIGSGYGGAVAAARLAGLRKPDGSPVSVCVLERGREYLPGAFPDRLADLAGHVRFNTPGAAGAKGRLDGLFDMRMGDDVSVLLANGLGGGSLINAGVMVFPSDDVFDGSWPRRTHTATSASFPSHAALEARADRLRDELGATGGVRPETFARPLARAQLMTRLGGRGVPITVALDANHVTSAGVQLDQCVACGDCATGCNVGAKDSLDVNLLAAAHQRGARLVTGATVTRIDPHAAGWSLTVWHTPKDLRERMADAFHLRATRVILAAGTLGSTDILMRSRSASLPLSDALGKGFSGNGDVLAAAYDTTQPVNGVAREAVPAEERRVGPTITSMVDQRSGAGFVLQDLGVPGALRRLFEEATATAATLHDLESADESDHSPDKNEADPCAIDPRKVDRSLAVALICRDSADGVMRPVQDGEKPPRDAGVTIDWKAAKGDVRLDSAFDAFSGLLSSTGVGGRALPNPLWRMLPPGTANLLRTARGPLLSVHPLGGCRMADEHTKGVVNGIGQVFDTRGKDTVHDGLVVLDGSIVPTSLGINPSLTIATLADFAVEQLIGLWQLSRPRASPAPTATVRRPVFKDVRLHRHAPPLETQVQVIERLLGQCTLNGEDLWVELSLLYENTRLHGPEAPGLDGHVLPVKADASLSRVRVFATQPDLYGTPPTDDMALFVAPVTGNLRFFHREASTAAQRRKRAWKAWLANRGLRDAAQALGDSIGSFFDRFKNVPEDAQADDGAEPPSLRERWQQSRDLATRAGEVRLFDYDLTLGAPSVAQGNFRSATPQGSRIAGSKRITYERRCSPWTQLMRMTLSRFGSLSLGPRSTLDVEPVYFARRQVPLMRVVQQQDQPTALVDTAAFLLYVARIFIKVHLWTFRKPDSAEPREPRRLPTDIEGLPPCEQQSIPFGDGSRVILTRYRPRRTTGPSRPVLLVHGYSANGRSFAHEALRHGGLAGHLAREGFEPWVVDLRTSSGNDRPTHPYSFEDIASNDLPRAVQHICEVTGQQRIDVVSHCMGSAMMSMAILADGDGRYPVEQHLRRWVMSQIGPAMHFAPANTLRAFLVRYMQYQLPGLRYDLTAGGEAAGVSANLFDRFLSGLPYLEDEHGSEFDVENPRWPPWKRTPWVGTRHRLDALIGRTFDARTMSDEALNCIDDFFGPLSLVTMSQPIHFVRHSFVTDQQGIRPFGIGNIEDRLGSGRPGGAMPLLSLHGARNGLAHPSTLATMAELARDKQLKWESVLLPGHGHQDCLIGDNTKDVFARITEFLSRPDW